MLDEDLAPLWNEFEHNDVPNAMPLPEWDGAIDANTRLFLHAESDLGSQIQCASCLPELLPRLQSCVLACDGRLVPLFQRSFPVADVVTNARLDVGSACRAQLPLEKLPRFLRRTLRDFPRQVRFLAADAQAVRRWKLRLADLAGDLRIGLAWRDRRESADLNNGTTPLDAWKPVLQTPGVAFINLQCDSRPEELTSVGKLMDTPIADWDDVRPKKHLDDFAAQIAALDLVITADENTGHLAAALGVPVWLLLSREPADDWQATGPITPWYATLRLYDSSQSNGRIATIREIAADLRNGTICDPE